jgi:conjugal transfer pilus assembly protein TraE
MRLKLYHDLLANARAWNWILLALVAGLVIALIANGFFRRTVILHVAPTTIAKDYWASASQSSDEYKKQIALSLIPYVADVSPASVRLGHSTFLRYVAAESYGRLSEALGVDEEYIIKYNLNRHFTPEYARVMGDEVILGGRETRYIGHVKVAEEDREYRLVLKTVGWQVQVVDLTAGLFTRRESQAAPSTATSHPVPAPPAPPANPGS